MPQGNDSKVLAVLTQLKRAKEHIDRFDARGCQSEERLNINHLSDLLDNIIATYEFDDEHYDAAPVRDETVSELHKATTSFANVLKHSLFNRDYNKHVQKTALNDLEDYLGSENQPQLK